MLVFCFVFVFVFFWNWNCSQTLYIPFDKFSSAHTKIKSARIYWPLAQWGGIKARYCAPVHSRAVKWSKCKRINVCGQTIHVLTTSITYDGTNRLSLFMELSQCVDVNFVMTSTVAGTCFKRTFPQVRSPLPSCKPREKWCNSQKQTEVIFDLSRPLPPKVRDRTASNNSHPRARKGWTCPCSCARDIEPCINDEILAQSVVPFP